MRLARIIKNAHLINLPWIYITKGDVVEIIDETEFYFEVKPLDNYKYNNRFLLAKDDIEEIENEN